MQTMTKKVKKKIMSVTGFEEDEIKVELILGRTYKVKLQAKGCPEKIVKEIKM